MCGCLYTHFRLPSLRDIIFLPPDVPFRTKLRKIASTKPGRLAGEYIEFLGFASPGSVTSYICRLRNAESMYDQADNNQPSEGQDYEPYLGTSLHRLQRMTLAFLIRHRSKSRPTHIRPSLSAFLTILRVPRLFFPHSPFPYLLVVVFKSNHH